MHIRLGLHDKTFVYKLNSLDQVSLCFCYDTNRHNTMKHWSVLCKRCLEYVIFITHMLCTILRIAIFVCQ